MSVGSVIMTTNKSDGNGGAVVADASNDNSFVVGAAGLAGSLPLGGFWAFTTRSL